MIHPAEASCVTVMFQQFSIDSIPAIPGIRLDGLVLPVLIFHGKSFPPVEWFVVNSFYHMEGWSSSFIGSYHFKLYTDSTINYY